MRNIAQGLSVGEAIDAYLKNLDAVAQPEEGEHARQLEVIGLVELMFLMAAVDGSIEVDELTQLHQGIEGFAGEELLSGVDIGGALDEMDRALAEEGWQARLQAAAGSLHSDEIRRIGFRLAATVAFVDDFVANAEAAGIEAMARALKIDDGESQTILREVHETLFGG